MKTRKNYELLVVWILAWLILELFFIPTLIYKFLNPYFFHTFDTMRFPNAGSAILRWDICLCNQETMQVTFLLTCLVLFGSIYFYNGINKIAGKTGNSGNEHGSARLMTEKEFDLSLPFYYFHPDEYKYPGPTEKKGFDENQMSHTNIFDKMSFKENKETGGENYGKEEKNN